MNLNLWNELIALLKPLSLLNTMEQTVGARISLLKEKVQCQTLTESADNKEINPSLWSLSSKLLVSASIKEKLIK